MVTFCTWTFSLLSAPFSFSIPSWFLHTPLEYRMKQRKETNFPFPASHFFPFGMSCKSVLLKNDSLSFFFHLHGLTGNMIWVSEDWLNKGAVFLRFWNLLYCLGLSLRWGWEKAMEIENYLEKVVWIASRVWGKPSKSHSSLAQVSERAPSVFMTTGLTENT